MSVIIDSKIADSIPHRPPMLLVDKIVELDESKIVCEKTFLESEYFFQGHYPEFPICPGIILCECGAQSGAILLSQLVGESDEVPVLTRMDNVRFKRIVRPGETITIEVKLDDQLSGAFYLTAIIKCENQTAARFNFVCATTAKPTS